MTQYVYMNERIRQARPRKPVIVVQRTNPAQRVESNCFAILVGGRAIGRIVFSPEGLAQCESHEVKAWIELDDDVSLIGDTEIVTEQWLVEKGGEKLQRVQASAKEPNKPVKLNTGLFGDSLVK